MGQTSPRNSAEAFRYQYSVLMTTNRARPRLPTTFSVHALSESPSREERVAWLAFLPILLTGFFYLLPLPFQHNRLIQFLPQLSAYLALVSWLTCNTRITERLGLNRDGFVSGIQWGSIIGFLLGGINTVVILAVVPSFGGDIMFLKETPHATAPAWMMVPWGILGIAVGVELNFRGFLLGRLVAVGHQWLCGKSWYGQTFLHVLAVVTSALVFAFDPFMVTTFRHLHWIAIWDGCIWGWIVVRTHNLYAVIVAHAVEVVILYLSVKAAFGHLT